MGKDPASRVSEEEEEEGSEGRGAEAPVSTESWPRVDLEEWEWRSLLRTEVAGQGSRRRWVPRGPPRRSDGRRASGWLRRRRTGVGELRRPQRRGGGGRRARVAEGRGDGGPRGWGAGGPGGLEAGRGAEREGRSARERPATGGQ